MNLLHTHQRVLHKPSGKVCVLTERVNIGDGWIAKPEDGTRSVAGKPEDFEPLED